MGLSSTGSLRVSSWPIRQQSSQNVRHFPAQRFDRLELDLRGYMHVRGAAFSWLRFKLADIVLI